MFHSKKEKNDEIGICSAMFKPCLWYGSKLAAEKLSYHSDVLGSLKNATSYNAMGIKQKRQFMRELFQGSSVYDPEKNSEETIETLKKVKAFTESNFDLDRAKAEFLECMEIISLSRDYMHSKEKGVKYVAAARIVKSYQRKYGFPFTWSSSETLCSRTYPIVFTTKMTREHCILLAWRVIFLSLNEAISNIDPCENLCNILKHSDRKLSTNLIMTRYAVAKEHLMYAYVLINQIVPYHMRQLSGTLSNHATTDGAIVMPELNPHVASAFSVFVMSLIQQTFMINTVSHFLKMRMRSDVLINTMSHLLNEKEVDEEDRVHFNANEKTAYSNVVNAFIDLCHDNRDIIQLVSVVFQLCHQSSTMLERFAWNHQIVTPFRDVLRQNIDEILPSKISKHEREFVIHSWSNNDVVKTETMFNVYKRTMCARNMQNYLLGTCVYMECLMDCYEISRIMAHEMPEFVMPMLSNLTKKVEMLMLPCFDRRQCGTELMAWIIRQIEIRSVMCDSIANLFSLSNTEMLELGKRISYIWKFMVFERTEPPKIVTSIQNVKSFIETVVPIRSKKPLNAIQMKKIVSKIDDEEDVAEDGCENIRQLRTVKLPFNDDDIKLWTIVVAHYPRINDPKMTSFSRVPLYSYSRMPAKILIPQGFCAQFNSILIEMAKK
jgi:hypothetical protein